MPLPVDSCLSQYKVRLRWKRCQACEADAASNRSAKALDGEWLFQRNELPVCALPNAQQLSDLSPSGQRSAWQQVLDLLPITAAAETDLTLDQLLNAPPDEQYRSSQAIMQHTLIASAPSTAHSFASGRYLQRRQYRAWTPLCALPSLLTETKVGGQCNAA